MIQKIQLGKTDEQVSEFSLGAMYFGTKNSEKESEDILNAYVEYGGSFVDTANIYASWVRGGTGLESETFLGKWFAKTGRRKDIFLATKVGFDRVDIGFGLRRQQIIQSCENSLRLMKTDHIDLFYAHTDDRHTPLEETMEAFARLHRMGKVRYLGASNYVPWRMEQAKALCELHAWPQFVCLQQRFTYLKPVPLPMDRYHIDISDDLQDYALDAKLTLLAYSPLLGGYYNHQERALPALYSASYNEKRVQALNEVVDEIGGVTPNQVVLAWMRRQPAPIIPLVAGSSVAQIKENIESLKISLTDEQVEKLNLA